jgi:hypothetical protein
MCINEEVISQIQGEGDKSYNGWSQKCNIAVEIRKKELEDPSLIRK